MRLAAELARTLDALIIEEVDPTGLRMRSPTRPNSRAIGRRRSNASAPCSIAGPHFWRSAARIDLDGSAQSASAHGPRSVGGASRPRASPSRRASRPRRRRSRPCLPVSRGMPGGMVVFPGLSLSNAMSEEEWDALGPDERGRAEETHPQYHLKVLLDRIGVAARRGAALAVVGPAASPAVADPRDRPCDDRRRLQRQMEAPEAGGAAADRHPRARTGRSGRRSAGDCAGDARSAGNAGADGGAGDAGPFAGAARVGASRAVGYSGGRQRRAGAVADCRRAPCCWRSRPPLRRTWRRCRCSHCSSIRWSAARARSGVGGWTMSGCSTLPCAGRALQAGSRESTSISRGQRRRQRAWQRIPPAAPETARVERRRRCRKWRLRWLKRLPSLRAIGPGRVCRSRGSGTCSRRFRRCRSDLPITGDRRRAECSINCSTACACGRPMAAIRACSSGACSRRGCSRPT